MKVHLVFLLAPGTELQRPFKFQSAERSQCQATECLGKPVTQGWGCM